MTSSRVADVHRRVTIMTLRDENYPNSPPNAPYIGNLKGQIRRFLPLSARSLPVFAVPNASPSVTSVGPLLYHLPLLAYSLSLSSLLPSDGSTFYSGTKICIFCHRECDNYPILFFTYLFEIFRAERRNSSSQNVCHDISA